MYEEYQNNPNPGFDPRQKYEDAGGYLRSILGSFLSQKKDAEALALEAKRRDEDLEQLQLNRENTGPEATRVANEKIVADYIGARGIDPASEEAADFRRQVYGSGWNARQGTEYKANATNADTVTKADASVKNTNAQIGGRQVVVETQQAGANERAADANATKITTAGMPGKGGAAPKGFSPTMTADSFRLNSIANEVTKIKKMAAKAGDVDTEATYGTLAKFLTDYVKEIKTKTFTQAQSEALDKLKESLAKGDILTAQVVEDFVAAWGLPDRDPNAPAPPPVDPSAFGTTWQGIKKEPEVISQNGRRFLKEGDQMYEMVMG